MKLFLPIALLCLLAVVSCKKADQPEKEKSHAWSQKKNHNVKKYSEDKSHHHDKHQKIHLHKYPVKHEQKPEGKRHKVDSHQGYHEVPKHEVELQKDIKSSKKEIEDRLAKDEQDLHLQDLTHPSDPANAGHKNHKNPHEYQKGHHKASQHSKDQKAHHHQTKEEKLFPELKDPEIQESHPILEDSFEAVGEKIVHEQPEHSYSKKKDSNKNKKQHKKAYEKVKEKTKEKTKNKESEKTKKEKKNKKQYKEKKEKEQ